VAELTPRGLGWILSNGTAIEDPTGRDAPSLGGLVVGGEEVERGLVAAELLLQTTILIEGPVQLLLKAPESIEDLSPFLLREGHIPLSVFIECPLEEQGAHDALA